MLLIVAWHWFIYTGAIDEAYAHPEQPINWIRFALCGFGKTGINCFVLITGFFLYKSEKPFVRKIVNLLSLVIFYSVVGYAVACVVGVIRPSLRGILNVFNPFTCSRGSFVPNYLVLLVVAPFLNALIAALAFRRHLALCVILVALGCILPMVRIRIVSDTLLWFMTLYLVGAVVAKYPLGLFTSRRNALWAFSVTLVLTLCSIVVGTLVIRHVGLNLTYYLIFPETRPLAFASALTMFLVFKNIDMPYSPVVNQIGSSTFGVYLLSDGWLREWIWGKTLALGGCACIVVFMVCSIVDVARKHVLVKTIECIKGKGKREDS